jgi:hypothetical protein
MEYIHTMERKRKRDTTTQPEQTKEEYANQMEHKERCRIRHVGFPQRQTSTNTPDDGI